MVELKAIVGNPWFKPLLILLVGLFLISSLDFASVNADHRSQGLQPSQAEINCLNTGGTWEPIFLDDEGKIIADPLPPCKCQDGTISDTGECEDQEPPSEQTLLQRVWAFIRDLILPIIEGII